MNKNWRKKALSITQTLHKSKCKSSAASVGKAVKMLVRLHHQVIALGKNERY